MTKKVTTYKTCKKCSGIGRIDCYSHVASGRCYSCGGSGKIATGTKMVEVDEKKEFEVIDLAQVEKESAEFDYSTIC